MSIWYPYSQMKTAPHPLTVINASGCRLTLSDGTQLIDGISSWWSVIHGYNHPDINDAAKHQLEQLSHVMLCGLNHEPAKQLAKTLVDITPSGLNHVFFSDSGSVGVEVALKMAIQYWLNQSHPQKNKILALKRAYHGDTIGAMSVSDPDDGMHARFAKLIPTHYFLPLTHGYSQDPTEDIQALKVFLDRHHHELAAMIVEPLLQGAGGFYTYSPQYLAQAAALCKQYGVLFIADEIATGFGRTGTLFACEQANIIPDIMVLGKGLTAGYIGHAATLATDTVFDAFWSDSPGDALMHGPTFMGNPLACAIANKSIEVFLKNGYLEKIKNIAKFLEKELSELTHPKIKAIRCLGAMGCIEVNHPKDTIGFQGFAKSNGVWLRPFDRFIYTMPPYIISDTELNMITTVMKSFFKNKKAD